MDKRKREVIPAPRLGMRIWRGVTLQLILVAVLPLTILVLLVTFGSLRLHHEAMRSLVADRNLRAVQSAASNIAREVSHRGNILELLTGGIASNESLKDVLPRMKEDVSVFDGGVAVIDSNGQINLMPGNQAIHDLATSSDWEAILELMRTATPRKALYLSVRRIAGQQYVPVLVKRNNQEALIGLFSPNALLADSLAVISQKEPITILVVDQQFVVLYESGKLNAGEDLPSHPGIQSALAGNSGIDYADTIQGEHVIATSTIETVGWALMIEESWEDIASPLLRVTQNAPLIIVPILGLSLLALWFGLRQIVQPIQALEGKAADLAHGNFESIRQPVGGVPEIRHLQETVIEMATQLKAAQTSLHSYIGAITDSVENERRNLARELHDDTLQSLIALGQYTQYALRWNKDAKVEQTLNQITNLAEQGMKNLRRMVRGLRPIYIEDLGLATALEMQTNDTALTNSVAAHFHQEGEERRLNPEVEMAMYRIAQEALSNVRRHAHARNTWINLYFRADAVILEIVDDGQGFDPPPDPLNFARLGHYGLLGLHERAELVGAKLTIRSLAGEGTRISVRFTGSGVDQQSYAG